MSMDTYDEAAIGAIREKFPELNERLRAVEDPPFETDHARAEAMRSCAFGFVEGELTFLEIDVDVAPNGLASFSLQDDPICFVNGVAFHPGAQKDVNGTTGPKVATAKSGEPRLFVLDTGWLANSTVCDVVPDSYLKTGMPQGADLNRGHGPAILDIARTMMGEESETRMVLREPDYLGGTLGALAFMPAFDNNQLVGFVRMFGASSAVRALERMMDEHTPRQDDVLSLSFGTTHPQGEEAFAETIASFQNEGVHVVAAAGNVYTSEREQRATKSWPAALHDVVRVGSGSQSGADAFSALGQWITHYADGLNVPVDIPGMAGPTPWPDPNRNPGGRAATWTGTSFATPIVAAMIARDGFASVAGNQINHPSPGWMP